MTMEAKLALLLLYVVLDKSISHEDDEPTTEGTQYYQPGHKPEDCICVPFFQCRNGEIITDGSLMIDPRNEPSSKNNQEEDVEDDHVGNFNVADDHNCGPYRVCCPNPEATANDIKKYSSQQYVHHCGKRNTNGVSPKITSNEVDESEFGKWPWQAAILSRENRKYVFKCGGTLIDNKHILTVAHCAEAFQDDFYNLIVRLGEWDLEKSIELIPREDFGVSAITIHPYYKKLNYHNDVAILTLAKEISFKPHMESICLPRSDDNFTRHNCIVTGWGTDSFGKYSSILKEMVVSVMDNADCQKSLRESLLGRFFKLHEGFMCAGGRKKEDSCMGDGGGPLACLSGDKYYTLAGIVAWGTNCRKEGEPGVYVNVRVYTDWIISVTGNPPEEYQSTIEG